MLANKFSSSIVALSSRRTNCGPQILRILSAGFHGDPPGEDPIKNFEHFKVPNKVGVFEHHKLPQPLLDYEYNYPVCRDTLGIRYPGYWFKRKFVYVKEMEPELVVPDLTNFKLKPYVSYKTEDVHTKPFTAKDLFNEVYAGEVEKAYKENNLDTFDVPPDQIDEARLRALQTGSDLFEETPFDGVRAPLEYTMDV